MREVPSVRSHFYIGGGYVEVKLGSHVMQNQMYVERLQPVGGATKRHPIILIHGQAQSGTNWLNKPDGGTGWASRFVKQGYEVYIVDQPYRGRSPGVLQRPPYPAELIQSRFTAPEWDPQSDPPWPQAARHTQWPGTGVMGDPVFDAFYASQVPFTEDAAIQQESVRQAGAALLDKLAEEGSGSAVLVGHSQGGTMPLILADERPQLVAALVLLEPKGPPFRETIFSSIPARAWGLTDIRITYEPPVESDPGTELVVREQAGPDAASGSTVPCLLQGDTEGDPAPRQLANLRDHAILVMTGEASYHAPYDWATVRFLRQAGCHRTEHLELGSVGIHGNGHMFFMEKNSDQIQVVVEEWIRTNAG